jgi:hypothetical protein
MKVFLTVIVLIALLAASQVNGQSVTKKVLFLGNSYTSVNNLPQMISNVANSMGDTLEWDVEAPGGSYLYDHLTSTTSVSKIEQGNWDYVVLQEQSQAPTLPYFQIPVVFEYARKLDSVIVNANPCTETQFYMTWGRKNGDPLYFQVYSPYYSDDTYEYMDSLLQARYMHMADTNNAEVSPVGAVWNYIRQNHLNIELYQPDESHPSVAGTYLAACCFYTSLFRKDPTQITFNSSLSQSETINIKNAVKMVVYDSLLNWNIGKYDSIMNVDCLTSISENTENVLWEVYPNPASSYIFINHGQASFGKYNVKDMLGREVLSGSLPANGQQIDVSELKNSLYIVTVLLDNVTHSKLISKR